MTSRLVAIGGGSGSGKTTVAEGLRDRFGTERATLLSQDSYYRVVDWGADRSPADHNFDHPDALDVDLFADHLRRLGRGDGISVPVYDFATHRRTERTASIDPKELVIVEGTLVLALEAVRQVADLAVFVEASPDVRFIRRLSRDVSERGRTMDSVVRQYLSTVRPMHQRFVEPSRRWADLVVDGEGGEESVERVLERVRRLP